MHVKCSPEASGGVSLWYVIVKWAAHHLQVSLSVVNLAVLFDSLLFITEVLSLHRVSCSICKAGVGTEENIVFQQ
jgi:hypothetical protein